MTVDSDSEVSLEFSNGVVLGDCEPAVSALVGNVELPSLDGRLRASGTTSGFRRARASREAMLSFLGFCEFYKPISESNAGVAAITKRLIDRRPTPAQCYPIPNLIGSTIMGLHPNPSLNIERSADTERRIFHDTDRRLELWFDLLSSLLLMQDQSA